jgi:UDP-N-acetylglucosamine--N-acetylmuramyl-(pentapeptide) pyrophosphoryl-undecaprenol N-acetylglucosamine transferase
MHSPRVIISGGGTGGHVFPAIAIADAIKQLRPDAEMLFVGAEGRLEMERVPAAGYQIRGLWISGFQRRLTLKNLMFPFKVVSSMMRSYSIVREFKPQVAIGVGGYASGPLLRAASSRKIPTLIQEQNSFPGITNRILSQKVDTICVAYEGMEKWFPKDKIVLTGNPVRKNVTEFAGKRSEAAAYFGLDAGKRTLLVIGGSLGAFTINESIQIGLSKLAESGYQLIWQTGKSFAERATESVNGLNNPGLKTYPFIDRMDFAYAMADCVVSRAGAISVSELCLAAKPTIFVPSPNVAEDHQTKNARALSDKQAAILVSDADARLKLTNEVARLMGDEALQQKLSLNISALAHSNAAEHIAREVLKLIEAN